MDDDLKVKITKAKGCLLDIGVPFLTYDYDTHFRVISPKNSIINFYPRLGLWKVEETSIQGNSLETLLEWLKDDKHKTRN